MITLTNFSILVNKQNPLVEDYVPENLVDTHSPNIEFMLDPSQSILVVDEVLTAFTELQIDGKEKGFNIEIESGYRSYTYQKQIMDNYLSTKGEEWVYNYVASPGTSEHQTGLAIDLLLVRDGQFVIEMNEGDPEVVWVHQNAYKYGFIIRYPKNKEHITGYKYEPWHLRYIGKKLATYLKHKNITLDEYHLIEMQEKTSSKQR